MLTFLKLGGSLITDKTRPYTPRLDLLQQLAQEIAQTLKETPGLFLLLGHGSGSFGHEAARRFDTHRGVSRPEAWRGFAEVWYQASSLNRIVLAALRQADLPAVTISPFSSITAYARRILIWDLYPLQMALERNLLPVVHGDTVFDEALGGTILSTEDLFIHLAHELRPRRILLAGLEEGVWADFPARTRLLTELTPAMLAESAWMVGEAVGADVTGGMRAKVTQMLKLVEELPDLEVVIFSGALPGNLRRALQGEPIGTRLHR
ncbi:MAG: isopentenyl phosphate kinase [Anaerolineales bacterium]|nr:isopentenyl phosphate kinase [Anaerolineales bacterium]MDW8226287.1 isopentenyl phosphate kinase [Anaerolineales bacterium]